MEGSEEVNKPLFEKVRPKDSAELLGVSSKTLIETANAKGWDKEDGPRGSVYYLVPAEQASLWRQYSAERKQTSTPVNAPPDNVIEAHYTPYDEPALTQKTSSVDLIEFMREVMNRQDTQQDTLITLVRENTHYKAITDGKEREVKNLEEENKRLLNEIHARDARIKMLESERKAWWKFGK